VKAFVGPGWSGRGVAWHYQDFKDDELSVPMHKVRFSGLDVSLIGQSVRAPTCSDAPVTPKMYQFRLCNSVATAATRNLTCCETSFLFCTSSACETKSQRVDSHHIQV
jgi:hypothetical protein